MKKMRYLLSMAMMGLMLVSCSRDIIEKKAEWHSTTLVLNVSKTGFDGATKSAASWQDGDVVYLLFSKGSNKVQGKAVYSAGSATWTVEYYGTLIRDAEAQVSLWYFENAGAATTENVTLTLSTGIYSDADGIYTFPTDGKLVVTGALSPVTSRIRFKGTAGMEFTVSGVRYNTKFDLMEGALSHSDEPIALQVQPDGYTPLIYVVLTDTATHKLSITNADGLFNASCPPNILLIGKSGRMTIPTVDSHAGWVFDKFNGHEYVDLGLPSGTLWATCNVGATKPEEYGDYFAWGETNGYLSGRIVVGWSNYKWCNGSNTTMTKYCNNSGYGTVDNKTELDPTDDAARVNWGGGWRIPSYAQFDELISECNSEKTTQKGVFGCILTSKKNGKSIFLPAAGCRDGSTLYDAASDGSYWSSALNGGDNDDAIRFMFGSQPIGLYRNYRYYGHSVRPVYKEEIKVESLTLDKTSLTLDGGMKETLVATVFPENATDKTVVWESSNPAVATVSGGVVTYVVEGTATITATAASNSNANASCEVTCKKYDKFTGHEYVDLGLTSGTLWATCNVGATKPEEYGDYFAWGETSGYNSGKTDFGIKTYKFYNGSTYSFTKYITSSEYGTIDNKIELEIEDDAARTNWGGLWRMPSSAQLDELFDECNFKWATQNSVIGCIVTSKKNGNSIFLPAAGYRYGSSLYELGSYCYSWFRTLSEKSDKGCRLHFGHGLFSWGSDYRYCGYSVRPVLSE